MTITEETVTGEVVPYQPSAQIEEYRPRILMSPDEAKELSTQLRASMLAVLREDVDFGTIPGAGDKKNLLKPGAEKLLQWFGFGSDSTEVKIERDDPDAPSGIADKAHRIGVTYRTEVTKTIPGGLKVLVATCEGYAGYDEDRYYATAEEARAKAESRERSNAARYNRAVNKSKWEYITADYRAPWNTLIKMAQKRAFVGAAILATGSSGLFTQDMDDIAESKVAPPAVMEAARAAIEPLPQAAKSGLDAWFSALHWGDPKTWDTEQWCKALVKAGALSTETAPPKVPVPAEAHETLREQPPAEARAAKAANGQKPAADQPLPPSIDLEAQAFAIEADGAKTAEALAAVLNKAAAAGKMDGFIREPGGTNIGRLREFFKYCETTLADPEGVSA